MSSEVGFAVVCEDRVSVSCVRLPPVFLNRLAGWPLATLRLVCQKSHSRTFTFTYTRVC